MKADPKEVHRAVCLLFDSNTVVELRILSARSKGTISGYYDDLRLLSNAACSFSGHAPAVYWSLNPVNSNLLARAKNRYETRAKYTTTDKDIVRRRWILIDADPKRPAGISATDAEHLEAIKRVYQVREFLSSLDWPQPIVADSGNGAHLLYRIDLPNDEESKEIVSSFLKALARRFTDSRVEIDEKTFNASRICKVYGTLSAKGENIQERPHRLSKILEAPSQIQIVKLELLSKLTAHLEVKQGKNISKTSNQIVLRGWLEEHGIDIKAEKASVQGIQIETSCPFHNEHSASFMQWSSGAIAFHCFHSRCREMKWTDVRKLYGLSNSRVLGIDDITELRIARSFGERYGDRIRFCFTTKTWHVYDGVLWKPDSTAEIVRMLKEMLESLFHETREIENQDVALKIKQKLLLCEKDKTIKAILSLAQSELPIAVDLSVFDKDPNLLNVLNGTLELREQVTLREHRCEDLITKVAPVIFDLNARLELWDEFTKTATSGNSDREGFLRRFCGSVLIGKATDEKVPFIIGEPGSGKTTFLEALRCTLGDYAVIGNFESLMPGRQPDSPRADLAGYAGRRLVVIEEVPKNGKLDEQIFNKITGGSRLRARFLHANEFEFEPSFHIILAANNAPRVKPNSPGPWRRILKVPFDNTIPIPKDTVKETLRNPKVSAASILAWMIRGYQEWKLHGLNPPDEIKSATVQYRTECNPLREWIDQECVLDANAWTITAALRDKYLNWARRTSERPVSNKEFYELLRELGCSPNARGHQKDRGWQGIGLSQIYEEADSSLSTMRTSVPACSENYSSTNDEEDITGIAYANARNVRKCFACDGTEFYGDAICARCHPPHQ